MTVYIVVPDGFKIANIEGDGIWNYNENNRTIIWNFTTLNVTDPYLYLTGWFTTTGEYPFTASITSKTYNANNWA
ncbi:hypothetical protein [Methanobacterium petrolearium]|uniref:hypothetical protein n=1 Tax=Methanobacterium petrolearium TaxID=710190 RepID=UPI001AEA9F34|nr:hypothetical protein [Methanobacterium petrolearium]BDZ70084.1 hypothetical protein GCM10025861_06010 [Methanobacterium petrolearium]